MGGRSQGNGGGSSCQSGVGEEVNAQGRDPGRAPGLVQVAAVR